MRSSFFWRNRVGLTTAALMLLSLHLLSTGVGPSDAPAMPQQALFGFLRPADSGVSNLTRGAANLYNHYLDLVGVKRENERLKAEMAQVDAQQSRMRELELENQRLAKLLQLRSALGLHGVGAEVIGGDATGLSHTVILNEGSNSKLATQMGVVCELGVVGKIIAVTQQASRVLLIDDRNSALDVFDQRTRSRGIVAGRGDGRLKMKYVSRAAAIKEGDTVVTSGLDGFFPRGLLVGYVSSVDRTGPGLFLSVKVTPAVNFHELEQVLVITQRPPRVANYPQG